MTTHLMKYKSSASWRSAEEINLMPKFDHLLNQLSITNLPGLLIDVVNGALLLMLVLVIAVFMFVVFILDKVAPIGEEYTKPNNPTSKVARRGCCDA